MNDNCPAAEVLYALATDDDASWEVRQHVAACAACRQQVEEITGQSTTMQQLVAEASPAIQHTPAHPTSIGKYVIIGALSDDADSACYRGLHSVLHAEVSILVGKSFKVDSPAEQEPLISTARPLLAVGHPAVARLRDVGFWKGAPFLVHDYVPGRRLDRLPGDQPLSLPSIVQGGDLVLHALSELNRQHLPHGRLEPRSLIGTDNGQLVIVDLGRAWLTPTQPIGSDVRAAAVIFEQLLAHVPQPERGRKFDRLVQLCRESAASPALTPADFWQRWRKAGGLAGSWFW
jgi:hypothetical protein